MNAAEFIEQLPDGTFKGSEVLNQGDDNPFTTCNILVNHYKNSKTVNKLINLGTISQIGLKPIPAKDDDIFSFDYTSSQYLHHNGKIKDKREAPITWKNRNELDKDINSMNMEANTYYLFKNNKWYLIDLDDNKDKPLLELLIKSHEYHREI